MSICFAAPDKNALPLHIIDQDNFDDWLAQQEPQTKAWVQTHDFTAKLSQALLIPTSDGQPKMALVGFGSKNSRLRGRFHLAAAAAKLPAGNYTIASGLEGAQLAQEALGWLLQSYRYDRYKDSAPMPARLCAPNGIDVEEIQNIAQGEALSRDLINTPASDMGPAELEEAARNLAHAFSASFNVITADALLAQNYPMIHAVGRASSAERAPRLIDMRWGETGPRVTLVGKGVCFDTGGLNLKPGGSMGLMKKDMGGSACVLGLARMIMASNQNIQLRVLIPAVENAVSGNSFRPQDVLTSRKGLTVEINNTDAEGRLVLADALALADEENPDLIISMATLTGAARVAVGPDIAPYFTDDETLAHSLENHAKAQADPVWRMPFHAPYESMIEPAIADLDNAPSGGFAGSITAALFLRRFVSPEQSYMHFDVYGWQPAPAPARPKGGVAQGTRALFASLKEMSQK